MPVIDLCGAEGHRRKLRERLLGLPEDLVGKIIMLETSGPWCSRGGAYASIHASVEVSQSDIDLLAQAIKSAGIDHCPLLADYSLRITPTYRKAQVRFYGLDTGAESIDLVKQAIFSSGFEPGFHNVASKSYRLLNGAPAPFVMIRPADRRNNDILCATQMSLIASRFIDTEGWTMTENEGIEMHFYPKNH